MSHRAFIRTLCLLTVAFAFSFASGVSAHTTHCSSASDRCDQGQAYSAVVDAPPGHCEAIRAGGWATSIKITLRTGSYLATFNCRDSAGQYAFETTHASFYTGMCSARNYETGWKSQPGGGQSVCSDGCAYTSGVEAGTPNGYSYGPTGNTCKVGEFAAPEPVVPPDNGGGGGGADIPGDSGGGGGSDGGGNDGGGSEGGGGNEGGGDNNGGDGDGGGNTPGQGEGQGEASGGTNCEAPPSCSGDPIACNTNWQIWRMRCDGTATGKVDGDVRDCSKPITVTSPDPLANAQMLLQRKIACKDGEQPDWTKVTGDGNEAGEDPDPSKFVKTVTLDPTRVIEQQGFLGGGSCPTFGSVTIPVIGTVVDFGAVTWFCDLMTFVRGLVILFLGAIPAVLILLSRNM